MEETSTLVQRALAQLSPEQARAEKKAISDASLHVFARILRERRALADMSRETLAKRARIAVNTIRHIEEAAHAPSRTTMVRLLSVPELRLQAGEGLTKEDPTFRPHSWFAPKYDPVGMMVDLIQFVNGPGGHLEQSYQYIDSQS